MPVRAPRAAVVGTGFGCRVHVPALRAAGFDVVALVGRDAGKTARRAERAGIEHACTSLDDALVLGLDAVTIASPPYAHAEQAIEAARRGVAVLCEKPFALDAGEAGAMLAAAQDARVTNLVGHEFRWATDRALAGRLIAAGAIGEPRLMTLVQYVALAPRVDTPAPEWWFDRERGGGWLGASGSHVIDQVRTWLGDEITHVSAALPMVSARDPAHHAEDSFSVRATTARGVEVVIQQTAAAWDHGAGAISAVAGTEGTVWLHGGDVLLADASGTRRVDVPADLVLPAAPAEPDDPRHRFTHLELGPYTRLGAVLLQGARGEPLDAPVPIPTFADGVAECAVMDAVRRSTSRAGELTPV